MNAVNAVSAVNAQGMSTISLDAAATGVWDAIVIGAGPAGALAAHGLAKSGARVLLLDKARFPRDKVCGGCLSAAGLAALHQAGLGAALTRCAGAPLHHIRLHARGVRADVDLPGGLVITRRTLDASLIAEAVRAGACFLDGAAASVGTPAGMLRTVRVRWTARDSALRARVVIAADGLAGHCLDQLPGFAPWIRPSSRMGLALILENAGDRVPEGIVLMSVAQPGYVGMARAEASRLIIGAALTPEHLRAHSSPAEAVAAVLRDAEVETPKALHSAHFTGTPLLTRRRAKVEADRLLVLGDASGYIEPFTGEGMTWAIHAARAVVPHALAAIADRAQPGAWMQEVRRAHRTLPCRAVATALRRPLLTRTLVRAASLAPRLSSALAHFMLRPPRAAPARFPESVPA